MNNSHQFNAQLNWNLKEKPDNFKGRFYTKNHSISFDQKTDLEISAAKTFKGDPTLHNPEDLLLASLTSCHMMSFLYCCSVENLEVLKYVDNSELILNVNSDGSGKITKAILNPLVKFATEVEIFDLNLLHKKASKLCFIANSCNFTIEVNPNLI